MFNEACVFMLLFVLITPLMHSWCWITYFWLSQRMKEEKKKKRHIHSTVWLSRTKLVEDCVLAVCVEFSPDEIPVSRVTLFPANPTIPLNCTQHKAVMNLSPPATLSWTAGSLSSQSSTVTASCAQPGFPFCRLSPKTKRVVSMLSENYSAQDISPSYLHMLKATFLPESSPFG